MTVFHAKIVFCLFPDNKSSTKLWFQSFESTSNQLMFCFKNLGHLLDFTTIISSKFTLGLRYHNLAAFFFFFTVFSVLQKCPTIRAHRRIYLRMITAVWMELWAILENNGASRRMFDPGVSFPQ